MKTDDEIKREKDAVQRMVGAKSAMETALTRIARLERILGDMALILDEASKKAGPDLYIKTFYHGTRADGEQFVPVSNQLKRLSEMARSVL